MNFCCESSGIKIIVFDVVENFFGDKIVNGQVMFEIIPDFS